MRVFSGCIVATALVGATKAAAAVNSQYSIQDAYLPGSFFDKFDFFTDLDPTHGFVQYVNQSYAQTNSLIGTSASNGIYIGVDHTNTFSTSGTYGVDTGRPSVRLHSKETYNHGLFILSLNHMPYGCGAWPAFWTFGARGWPTYGEIDILENVNTASQNLMSLHTSEGCTIAGQDETGTLTANDCWSDGGAHVGCSVESDSSNSFGSAFNGGGGGIYAMEWTSDSIKIWNWQHGSEPSDIDSASPDPGSWGLPAANFQGSCDIDSSFQDHTIVFDITWCGDWAGATYGTSSCTQTPGLDSAGSCVAFVAQNPTAFQDTYWDINYLKVYQQSPASSSSSLPSTNTPLSSVSPVLTASSSLNIGLGASTTETKASSATVIIPSQASTPSSKMSVAASGTTAFMYTQSACVVNNVIPTTASVYGQDVGTAENCAQFCYTSRGNPENVDAYVAMALGGGKDCYCFDEAATAVTTTDGCTLTCSGNSDESCGGSSAVDLYLFSGISTDFRVADSTDEATPASTFGWISSISSATPALPTITDPAEPQDNAYFQDVYGNKAQIYGSAKLSNGIPADFPAFGYGYIANSLSDCIGQCNDYNFNVAGWDYAYCRGVSWYNGSSDFAFGDGYSNCQFIVDPNCNPQGWNNTNFCGDHSGVGFYNTGCAALTQDERASVASDCSDCTGDSSLWSGNPDNPNYGASCQADYDPTTWTQWTDDATWSHAPDEQPYQPGDNYVFRRQAETYESCAIVGEIQSDLYTLCRDPSLSDYYVAWYVDTRNYLDNPENTDDSGDGSGGDGSGGDGSGGDDGSSVSPTDTPTTTPDDTPTNSPTSPSDNMPTNTAVSTPNAATTDPSLSNSAGQGPTSSPVTNTASQISIPNPTLSGDNRAITTSMTVTAADGSVQVITEVLLATTDAAGNPITLTNAVGTSTVSGSGSAGSIGTSGAGNSIGAGSTGKGSTGTGSTGAGSTGTVGSGGSGPVTTAVMTTLAGGIVERVVEVLVPTTLPDGSVSTITSIVSTSTIYDPAAATSPSQITTTDADGNSITLSVMYVTTCAPPELSSLVYAANATATDAAASSSSVATYA